MALIIKHVKTGVLYPQLLQNHTAKTFNAVHHVHKVVLFRPPRINSPHESNSFKFVQEFNPTR